MYRNLSQIREETEEVEATEEEVAEIEEPEEIEEALIDEVEIKTFKEEKGENSKWL